MDIIVNKPVFNEKLKGKKIKLITTDGQIEYATVRGYYVFDPEVLSLESYSANSRNLIYIRCIMEGRYTIEVVDEFPEDIKKHSMHDANYKTFVI